MLALHPDGQLVCGVWTEYHATFAFAGFDRGETTMAVDLALVDSYLDQVNGESTLFDLNASAIANQLTVMFTVYDTDGNYADCARYGYDSSYYAADCANSWD